MSRAVPGSRFVFTHVAVVPLQVSRDESLDSLPAFFIERGLRHESVHETA